MSKYPSHCEALNVLKPHEDEFGLGKDVPMSKEMNLLDVLPQSLLHRFMFCGETDAFSCKNEDCPNWVE